MSRKSTSGTLISVIQLAQHISYLGFFLKKKWQSQQWLCRVLLFGTLKRGLTCNRKVYQYISHPTSYLQTEIKRKKKRKRGQKGSLLPLPHKMCTVDHRIVGQLDTMYALSLPQYSYAHSQTIFHEFPGVFSNKSGIFQESESHFSGMADSSAYGNVHVD